MWRSTLFSQPKSASECKTRASEGIFLSPNARCFMSSPKREGLPLSEHRNPNRLSAVRHRQGSGATIMRWSIAVVILTSDLVFARAGDPPRDVILLHPSLKHWMDAEIRTY